MIFGNDGKNEEFKPQDEFKLEPWLSIKVGGIDFSINRAVFYLVLASALTIFVMVWISRRMQQKPNRVQTTMELAYDLTRNNITGGNLEQRVATRWFPFLATLFFFLWFSNVIGYLPLPTNTARDGQHLRPRAADLRDLRRHGQHLGAAGADSRGLDLATTWRGSAPRASSPTSGAGCPPAWRSMNPVGKGLIFVIEVISHFVRLISLSVRLFANILAGHLLLLFMGGGLAVLLGLAALGALTFPLAFLFFVLELGLIATLQAFIFSMLTAIYIGGATAESH